MHTNRDVRVSRGQSPTGGKLPPRGPRAKAIARRSSIQVRPDRCCPIGWRRCTLTDDRGTELRVDLGDQLLKEFPDAAPPPLTSLPSQ